jgi:hypothetical protein
MNTFLFILTWITQFELFNNLLKKLNFKCKTAEEN